eukprot:4838487-Pyramimonas_sp.AAC.1
MAASAALEKALNEVTAQVTQVLKTYEGVDTSECASQIASASDQLCNQLLAKNLAYKERVRCTRMAPHHNNRFGLGVDVLDVHELLDCIVKTGWRWTEVLGA